ncbi:unnamed protein product [Acanthoscelides obtectus]|uniref:Uncharacterized protein n=1 Tax=Acanthoscelides obtectus TaxID=200917 RepID=A0A9P0VUF9_ACAOB|nr:unnamed protein product [Acanthoscelides obtectus]CAK1684547.1 hypothetical protein AOBTE_LOCUS34927 [Acanthoscelides obtectus]
MSSQRNHIGFEGTMRSKTSSWKELKKKGPEVAITVETDGGGNRRRNLKPDLVIQSRGRVFVVDVTVRHEDGNNLAQGFTKQSRKI